MSGIRYLIALLFLFAGLESELRASASQAMPANFSLIPSDIITNLNSKTSVDKMTKAPPARVHGTLAERVIYSKPRMRLIFDFFPYETGRTRFRHAND